MSNAIKYTKKGIVRVDAVCDTNSLKISVVDTGVGIEPSRVAGLFNAFTKIMRNREMNQEGVGLGLSISKNLAKALGGDITVESLLGVGSKFIVIIPLKRNKRDRKTFLEQKVRDTSAYNSSQHQQPGPSPYHVSSLAELGDDQIKGRNFE